MKPFFLSNFVLVLLLTICLNPPDSNAQSANKNKIGICYWALQYEKESGFEVNNSAYLLLDSIVNDCKSKITPKTHYSSDEAINVLSTIGSVIKSYNIQNDTLNLLSQALESRKMNSTFLTLTYLTVGENLSLPLYTMVAPKHTFICWKDTNNEIYWETIHHWKTSKQLYIDSLKIANEAIANGAFLHPIDYAQSKLIVYHYLGDLKINLKKYPEAIADYSKNIELYTKDAMAYYNRGIAKDKMKQYTEAIADFTEAIALNPRNAEAYNNRGNAKDNLKNYYEAIADYSKAIEINPDFAAAYYNRGITKIQLENFVGAIDDYTKAIEINPGYAEAYCNRGGAKYKRGDLEGACKDWKTSGDMGDALAISLIKQFCK
ncbi:MAG: tetratricopeptide repeat protein [Bacteroidota bacterium]